MLAAMAPIQISEYLSPELIEKFRNKTRPGKWGCLEWRGARNRGYGVLEHDGRTFFAHRVAWVIHHQVDIPGWLVVDHLCCNTPDDANSERWPRYGIR